MGYGSSTRRNFQRVALRIYGVEMRSAGAFERRVVFTALVSPYQNVQ